MSNEAKDDKPQVDIKEAIDALQELQRVLRSTSVTILAVLKRYTTKNPPCCFAYSAIPIGQAVVDLTQGLSMHLPCMLMEAATWEQVKVGSFSFFAPNLRCSP